MFLQPDWFEVTKAGVGTNRYAYSFNDPVNGRDPEGNLNNTALKEGLTKAAGIAMMDGPEPGPADVIAAVVAVVAIAQKLNAPKTGNVSRIVSGIAAKKDQARVVIVDLSNTTATADDFSNGWID